RAAAMAAATAMPRRASTSLAVAPRRPTASTRAGRTPVLRGTATPTARAAPSSTRCRAWRGAGASRPLFFVRKRTPGPYKAVMTDFNHETLPGDLKAVAERLRSERPEASGLDLDRIEPPPMARAAAPRAKG